MIVSTVSWQAIEPALKVPDISGYVSRANRDSFCSPLAMFETTPEEIKRPVTSNTIQIGAGRAHLKPAL